MRDKLRRRLAAWALCNFDFAQLPYLQLRYRDRVWQLESAVHTTALHGVEVLVLRMRPPLYFIGFTDDYPDF